MKSTKYPRLPTDLVHLQSLPYTMPSGKRKSPESDQTSLPVPRLTTASKRTRSNTTSISKNKYPIPGSSPDYIATEPSLECTYDLQTTTCTTIKNPGEGFEKCVSCIEKQSYLGACRFVGIRAFNVVCDPVEDDQEEEKEESSLTAHGIAANTNKNKAEGKEYKQGSGASKNGSGNSKGKTVNYSSGWTFLGNQPSDYIPLSSLDHDLYTPTESSNTTKLPTHPKPVTRGRRQVLKVCNKVIRDTSTNTILKQAQYTLTLIAPVFWGQLSRENRHEEVHQRQYLPNPSSVSSILPNSTWTSYPCPLIRIQLSSETRSLCDLCATTIFLGSYLCGCCGREYCLGCWEEWEHTSLNTDTTQRGVSTITTCSRRRRHSRKTMIFTTRAAPGEIDSLLTRVEKYTTNEARSVNVSSPFPIAIPCESVPSLDETLDFLPVPKLSHMELTPERFQSHWCHFRGVPLVVTGLLPQFTLPWSPSYFLEHYGQERCLLNNCGNTNPEKDIIAGYVRDFFTKFDSAQLLYRDKTLKGSWKLKDWPPSDDFALVFPSLFQDFENALPSASWTYTTREGNMNLASKFPKGWNRPDLGPKMYNAYPAVDFLPETKIESQTAVDVKGTTNLHLDITDAINILVYASPKPDSLTCTSNVHLTRTIPPETAAIWDIFPPESAPRIRRFLHEHYDAEDIDDPIHRQLFYLSEQHLAMLSSGDASNGSVRSYRVYQRPGDAVFVPAGCPHQVRNTRGAIKVAVDFLSPEAVPICKGLVEEARALAGVGICTGGNTSTSITGGNSVEIAIGNAAPTALTVSPAAQPPSVERLVRSLGKREDVLQLWNCLYFTWVQSERASSACTPQAVS